MIDSHYTRTLDYDPGTDELVLTCSPRDRHLTQLIPGLRFHKATETWRGKPLLSTGLATRGVFGDGLEVTPEVYVRVQPEIDRYNTVRAVTNGEQSVPAPFLHNALAGLPADSPLHLRPEQEPAVYLANLQERFLIGDEKGFGKTIEAALALRAAESAALPLLVVATNSMKYTWAAEIATWTGWTAVVAGKTKRQREAAISAVRDGTAEVLVLSWDQLRLHSSLAPYGSVSRTDAEKAPKELNEIPFRAVIADEAHRAKAPAAKVTRALWSVAHAPSVRFRLALTATPVTGNTVDLWSILHFLRPDEFPSRSKFIDRYVLTHTNHWGGIEDLGLNPRTEAEFRQIFDPLHIRRPLSLNVEMLPIQYRFVDMEGKQATTYRKFEKESLVKVDEHLLVAVGPLVVNTRLQQLAQATPVLDQDADGNVQVTGMQLPSCKYDALCDLLDEMGDAPLVVFSDSRKLLELCYRELTTPTGRTPARFAPERVGRIYGGINPEDRTRYVNEFQEGKRDLMLCSIGAGSEGITLTRASTMCFLNRSYRYVGNNQAEGRLYRHGQTANVQIIDIITRDSEEYRIYESDALKENRLQQVLKDPEHAPRQTPFTNTNAPSTLTHTARI